MKKSPSILKNILRPFSSSTTFSQKCTPFTQNLLPFLCIFLSLSLFLLSFMFFFNKKIKNSRLIIGGQNRGFAPQSKLLGGACPGCPPESTPMVSTTFKEKSFNRFGVVLSYKYLCLVIWKLYDNFFSSFMKRKRI